MESGERIKVINDLELLELKPASIVRIKMDKLEKEISDSVKNMNFGDAIQALKAGEKVARAGWNGKGMYLKLVELDHYSIVEECVGIEMGDGHDVWRLLPWIGMKTADDKFVPWLASQTDMLAEDWQIVD